VCVCVRARARARVEVESQYDKLSEKTATSDSVPCLLRVMSSLRTIHSTNMDSASFNVVCTYRPVRGYSSTRQHGRG
jgi:hypothetical protein